MALSRLARHFAAEIKHHDWIDAPYRLDGAGHSRDLDTKKSQQALEPDDAERVKVNVMWVTAQVLGHDDPNFDIVEFARACGIHHLSEGTLRYGARRNPDGSYMAPPEL
ncbi:hypothetical protein [Nonomuraea zeae]|uniref:Uncharacterized protein n=1 Tax=Nonomuraea zeae TaxID=1642303 RepID=A0A5S4H3B5_9ACTN|nr:hypothetical protein [Nonomuraea zeae]TMR39596.1 hypothetical protein ETD85_00865 [Nonomuraea zeae]